MPKAVRAHQNTVLAFLAALCENGIGYRPAMGGYVVRNIGDTRSKILTIANNLNLIVAPHENLSDYTIIEKCITGMGRSIELFLFSGQT